MLVHPHDLTKRIALEILRRVYRAAALASLVLALAIPVALYLTHAATYVDASGAYCHAFDAGNHELDLCYGRIDR